MAFRAKLGFATAALCAGLRCALATELPTCPWDCEMPHDKVLRARMRSQFPGVCYIVDISQPACKPAILIAWDVVCAGEAAQFGPCQCVPQASGP